MRFDQLSTGQRFRFVDEWHTPVEPHEKLLGREYRSGLRVLSVCIGGGRKAVEPVEVTIIHSALDAYPAFCMYYLGGGRYTLVSLGIHKGAGFGCLEGETLHLWGVENFRERGGQAWQWHNLHDAPINGLQLIEKIPNRKDAKRGADL